MVYFKLTKDLLSLVHEARLQGLVGCQVYCDRQFISYADLEAVVNKLQLEYRQVRDLQAKRAEDLKRKEEARASGD